MKKSLLFVFIILSFLLLTIVYFIFKNTNTSQRKKDTINFVNKSIELCKEKGFQKTFDAINNDKEKYIQGDLYLFVYDFDGNCIAIGKYQDMIGKNFIEIKDDNGKYFIKEFIETVKNGTGWVKYIWKGARKESYIVKIEDKETGKTYIIGSGFLS